MNRLILCFVFLLIALLSTVSVCASDVDNITLGSNLIENNEQTTELSNIEHANVDNCEVDNLMSDNGQDFQSDNTTDIRMTSNILVIDGPLKTADLKTLQEEIHDVDEGSTLDLKGPLENNGKENKIIDINKDMTIDGHGNTIDFGVRKNCYIDINAGNVILKNIKFINGFNDKSDNGGALYIHKNAKVTIINCSFYYNFARKSGGAIYCENKNQLSIYNCTFNNNKADKEKGGAVYSKGDIIISNTTLTGNHAKEDGGAVFSESKVNVGHSLFESNTATGKNKYQNYGGAICCKGALTISNSTFKNNKADDYAGAAYSYSSITINNTNDEKSFFIGNIAADEHGGALYAKGDAAIQNAVFSGNKARETAGAVFSESKVNVGHCVFESNVASLRYDYNPMNLGQGIITGSGYENLNYGGAICCKGALTISNSTFKNNTADDYGGAAYSYSSITVRDANTAESFFIGNNAEAKNGGALYAKGDVIIQNTVFLENNADEKGGAIYSEGNVYILYSTIKNNMADDEAGAVWAKSKITVKKSVINQNFNSKSQLKQLYSKNDKVEIDNDDSIYKNSNVIFDDLSSVSLNKEIVNFWISNSNDLKELFEFITNNNPNWKIINITLAPYTVFNVDYNTFKIEKTDYSLRFAGDTIIFNGNPGSVISGKNHKNNFIYACPDTNVFFLNTNLECFNHCIVNLGNAICINSSFCDNEFHIAKRVKNQARYEVFGGVMVNYNTALFENCTFVGNKAIYDGKEHGCWGSILFAESYSQTYLANCKYYKNGDDCFYADKDSSIVLIQDHELDDKFKDCNINPEASLSAISYNAYKNAMGYDCVINCSNVDQLKKALYMVNSFLPGLSIVINLEPGVYEIPVKWIEKTKNLRSLDWRDEFYHPSVIEKANKNWNAFDKFALDVGIVPITINGNGATIKVSKLDDSELICFASVSYGGHLTLNNLTLSNFNHVFKSKGTIDAINCTFENNKHYCGKPILWGFKSNTYFTNCTFKPVDGRCADSNIFKVESNSYVKFENCDFDFTKGKKNIGNAIDSTVECPSYLKDKIWFNGDSLYFNTDEVVINESHCTGHDFMLVVQVVSANFSDKLSDMIKKTCPNTIVLNITCDCEIDLNKLNFKGNMVINGNNYNVKFINNSGKAPVIDKHSTLTINNITFSQYIHNIVDNKGTLNIINCNFTNNTCDYLINSPGVCNLINCTFTDNKNKNIFNSKGSLNMECCIFDNNTYTNKALIYNDGGSVFGENCTFNNVSNVVCNYLTPNCVLINCSNYTKTFDQPVHKKMATWKKYLIRGSLMVGLLILSALTSRSISNNIGSSPLLNTVIGGVMSYGFACLDDYIIGGYENDHSNRKGIIMMYLCIGIGGTIIGDTSAGHVYQENLEEYGEGLTIWKEIKKVSPMEFNHVQLEKEFYMNGATIEYSPEHMIDSFSSPQTINVVSCII